MIKGILAVMVSIVLILTMSFGLGLFGLEYKKFFGVRHENVNREIFEQTKSHIHGTIKNLSRLRLEYKTSKDESHRAALKEMILTETASFDIEKLPYDLRAFVRSLK